MTGRAESSPNYDASLDAGFWNQPYEPEMVPTAGVPELILSHDQAEALLSYFLEQDEDSPTLTRYMSGLGEQFRADFNRGTARNRLATVANVMNSAEFKAYKGDPDANYGIAPWDLVKQDGWEISKRANKSKRIFDPALIPPPRAKSIREADKVTTIIPKQPQQNGAKAGEKGLASVTSLASYEAAKKAKRPFSDVELSQLAKIARAGGALGISTALLVGVAHSVATDSGRPLKGIGLFPKTTAVEQSFVAAAKDPTNITPEQTKAITSLSEQLPVRPAGVVTTKEKQVAATAVAIVTAATTAALKTPDITPQQAAYQAALGDAAKKLAANPEAATPELQQQVAAAIAVASPAVQAEAKQVQTLLDKVAPSPATPVIAPIIALQQASNPHLAEQAKDLKAANADIAADPEAAVAAITAPTSNESPVSNSLENMPSNEVAPGDNASAEVLGQDWTINTTVTGKSGLTADQLNTMLADTQLAGLGQAYIDTENKYNINALYAIAHAVNESGWHGSALSKDRNNIYGYEAYDSNPNAAKAFPSMADAIDTWAQLIATDYLSPNGKYYSGGTSVNDVFVHYSSDGPGVDGEAGKVVNLINKNLLPEARKFGFLPTPSSSVTSTPETASASPTPESQATVVTGPVTAENPTPKVLPNGMIDGNTISGHQARLAQFATNVEVGGVQYYNQHNADWGSSMYSTHGDKTQTYAESACEPTMMASAVTTLTGIKVTPVDVANYDLDNQFRTYNSGTTAAAVPAYAASHGLDAQKIEGSAAVLAALQANTNDQVSTLVAVSAQDNNPNTTPTVSGHWFLIRLDAGNGKVWVVDGNRMDLTQTPQSLEELVSHASSMYVLTAAQ